MDNFLEEQKGGEIVETGATFTLAPERSREKILASIPKVDWGGVLRLLDAGVAAWGYRPSEVLSFHRQGRYSAEHIALNLPDAGDERIKQLLSELRLPFTAKGGATILAQALLQAASKGASAEFFWSSSLVQTVFAKNCLVLSRRTLRVPEELPEVSGGRLSIEITGLTSFSDYKRYRQAMAGRLHDLLAKPEELLPLESCAKETAGYWDYRTRPFTAIRTYARWPSHQPEGGLQLNLWKGPYTELDAHTAALNSKQGSRFLFLTWRPDYGRPTLLHHSVDAPLEFGPQRCRATFWVSSEDRPARVMFYSAPTLSEPVTVRGPSGLNGIVIWPGLTFDMWGSKLVANVELEKAMTWTQERIDLTAQKLSSNIDLVCQRLSEGNLVKSGAYTSEVVQKARQLWGGS